MTARQVECHYCGNVVDADKCTSETIEVATGRSGGSWSFGVRWGIFGRIGKTSGKGIRYNTGKKHYKNEVVYTCAACTAKDEKRRLRRKLGWAIAITIAVLLAKCDAWNKSPIAVNNDVPAIEHAGPPPANVAVQSAQKKRVESPLANVAALASENATKNATPEVLAEEWVKCQAARNWECAEEKARILLRLQPNDVEVQNLGRRTALSKSLHSCIANQTSACIESVGGELLAIEPTNEELGRLLAKISLDRGQSTHPK